MIVYEPSNQQHSASARGLTQLSHRRREFVAGLPVVETHSVQLGRGEGKYLSRRFRGRDLILMPYRLAPELSVQTVVDPAWVVGLLPLNPRPNLVVNGRAIGPLELPLLTSRDGYMTRGRERNNLVVVIRRTRLISACAALGGIGADDVLLQDLVLLPRQDRDLRLRRALIDAVTPPDPGLRLGGDAVLPTAVENDLVSLLAAQVLPAVRQAAEANPFRVDALRVVRTATALSRTVPAPSLAEMCEATGVGQRWLHKCFIDVLGVSPYRYVRLARLSAARERLLAPEAEPELIKTLSLSLGYRLSGRFAAEYRSVYGENPSATLQSRRQA
jgi:AraC-like DNA-binding protein